MKKTILLLLLNLIFINLKSQNYNHITSAQVEIGSIQLNQENKYPIQWLNVFGVVILAASGVILVATDKK